MVAIGEVRTVEVKWGDISKWAFAVRHHLTARQQRSLELIMQDLSSLEISYNLFAETRAFPSAMRESFHHAKCYVAAIKRFQRLIATLARDGWPKPVATTLKQLVKRDEPKLDTYTAARNAIEHVDETGRAALWWMTLLGDDLVVSKEASGNEIRVRVVGGDAVTTAATFLADFLKALAEHFGPTGAYDWHCRA
jgi:hypothetical protein